MSCIYRYIHMLLYSNGIGYNSKVVRLIELGTKDDVVKRMNTHITNQKLRGNLSVISRSLLHQDNFP